jgi:hypothetical protein
MSMPFQEGTYIEVPSLVGLRRLEAKYIWKKVIVPISTGFWSMNTILATKLRSSSPWFHKKSISIATGYSAASIFHALKSRFLSWDLSKQSKFINLKKNKNKQK